MTQDIEKFNRMDMTQAKMFVRSLNNSSAKVIMAFLFAHTALDVQELREWTGLKRQTIYDALDDLRSLGKLERQTLAHGRHVWLPAGDLLPLFQMSEKGTPEIQMSEERTPALPDVQKTDTTTLLVVEESINLNSLDSSSSINEQMSKKGTSGAKEQFPSASEILNRTDLLFDGSLVVSKDLDDREPLYVLAWCAYAYREKTKLRGAGGLVRNRLLDDQVPPEWAKQQWQEVLPNVFLEALGLIEYSCDSCDAKFKKMADLDAHEAAMHPKVYPCTACDQTFTSEEDRDAHYEQEHALKPIQPDESVTVPICGGLTAEQAWQSVLGQLQMEMPRASFDTWVRDSRAVRYDGNALCIGVRTAYARDWLDSRLRSTTERLLVGIMNTSVSVVFVVAEVNA